MMLHEHMALINEETSHGAWMGDSSQTCRSWALSISSLPMKDVEITAVTEFSS